MPWLRDILLGAPHGLYVGGEALLSVFSRSSSGATLASTSSFHIYLDPFVSLLCGPPSLSLSLEIATTSIGDYQRSPATTSDHQRPPATTSDHQRSPAITSDHQRPPASATTSDHQRPPATTSDHQRPPATTTIGDYQRPPATTSDHHQRTAGGIRSASASARCKRPQGRGVGGGGHRC